MIQHTDFSENTGQKLIDDRKKAYDENINIFCSILQIKKIKIIDSEIWFNQMSSEKKRLMWHDHHTPKGKKWQRFISQNINF